MKVISAGEFKSKMTFYIKKVMKGEEFVVSYRGKNNTVFKVSPVVKEEKPKKRELGILEGKATVVFHDDWQMSDEELLNA